MKIVDTKEYVQVLRELVEIQYSTYNRSLLPMLKTQGICVYDSMEHLTEAQQKSAECYFDEVVYPVLTPMAVDASRPFPLIRNKTLNIAALIVKRSEKGKKVSEKEVEFATVQVPSVLPRLVQVPSENSEEKVFILLEQIIEKNIDKLFLNYEVQCAYPYRIMRNADLTIDEDEASDLLKEIESKLKMRQQTY